MSQERQVILIIEAKDGAKYQGNFVSKDTEKLLITLSNVTKTFEGKDETFPLCEIKKEDIAKISMIENKPKKDEVENINEIPENKKTDNNVVNVEKVYDRSKDDFFDQLKTATNSDMKSVANFYNKKNADTFKLTQNEIDDDNDNKNMGRKRGRGRGFRGGFRGGNNRGRGGYDYNNKFNNYQGNNNNNRFNQQSNNYNNNYVNYGNNNYRNGNHRGYNNNHHRGRGNYQKNKNFHNGGNAQNYNKFNQNYNNQGNNGNNNQV